MFKLSLARINSVSVHNNVTQNLLLVELYSKLVTSLLFLYSSMIWPIANFTTVKNCVNFEILLIGGDSSYTNNKFKSAKCFKFFMAFNTETTS